MGFYATSTTCDRVPPKTLTPVSEVSESARRFYNPEMGRWVSRDPIGERAGISLQGFVANEPVNSTDSVGLWVTLDLPATPQKCSEVNRLLDRWALRHNQTLLDHWRSGSGKPLTLNFNRFDFGGYERGFVRFDAFKAAATAGAGVRCGMTATGTYNLAQPQGSNRHAGLESPMIYDYRFWWECSYSAKKVCLFSCCIGITLKINCQFHARDRIDFWNNPWDVFWVPPLYLIHDRLVRACNPRGRGFDVSAEDCSKGRGWATCGGTVLAPSPPTIGE
jgi:RHS repeat-associated protein